MKLITKAATLAATTAIASTMVTGVANAATPTKPIDFDRIPQWVTAINFASTKLGTPYLWGGTGTRSQNGRYDCSGLTQASYKAAGVRIPRVANDQYATTNIHPKKNELSPGDLVFYGRSERGIHHVGLYVGSGYMLHAPRTGTVIRFDRIDYMKDYYGATRVWKY